MFRKFNFKNDRRTWLNIAKFPAIIFVRIPFMLLYLLANKYSELIENYSDYLPGWNS